MTQASELPTNPGTDADAPFVERDGVAVVPVTTRARLDQCWSVRLDVFVGEQAVPLEEEIDDADLDPTTTHVLALDTATGADLGTARLLRDPAHPEEVHIGRMAVRREARGRRVGAMIMGALEEIARGEIGGHGGSGGPGAAGEVRVVLSAQEQAMGFYARLG